MLGRPGIYEAYDSALFRAGEALFWAIYVNVGCLPRPNIANQLKQVARLNLTKFNFLSNVVRGNKN